MGIETHGPAYLSANVRSTAHSAVSRVSMGATTYLPSAKTSNSGQMSFPPLTSASPENFGPLFVRIDGTGAGTPLRSILGSSPLASILQNACALQNRMNCPSAEYRGKYPLRFNGTRRPPFAATFHIAIGPP